MSPDTLAWVLGVHSVVLPFSLVGLYRYSDRSTLFTKAIRDTDELLAGMRRQIAISIENELTLVFQRAEGKPLIVSPHGYTERPINPLRSDVFREAVQRFVDSDVAALVDYSQVSRARNTWFFWVRVLSWAVLALSCWETLCVAILGLVGTVLGVEMPHSVTIGSCAPTAMLVAIFFSCHAGLMRQDDVIHDKKHRYPGL